MKFELRVNGDVFEGFESGTVQLTMEEAANNFDVEYVADGKQLGSRAIFAGDECQVAIEDDVVIEGYVDTTDDEDQADVVRLRASGRSRAADLIDCAAVRNPGSWANATLDQIATDLCKDFGVACFVEGNPGAKFPSFAVQKGESAYETIARAAIKRGFQVYSVGGDLVIARAGNSRTSTVLERGVNLVRSARSDSWYGRFSDYIFRGQARATDNNWGKNASQLQHKVVDSAINRFRPTLVHAEAHDILDLKSRATLERNIRAGKGERISALVEGWTTDEGKVWRPNTLVQFKNPVLGIDATVLIAVVRLRFAANQPRETELEMARPEAFSMDTYPVVGRGDTWK
ncbi:MAG TPA: hypothetical protein VK509_15590 [Polyangiales bacterium]|nr:hypothetical protein [Polyangiales bacterium]